MNRLKLAAILAAGSALALSPASAVAQAGGNAVSMGMKLEHVMQDGKDGGKVTGLLPDRTAAALGFKVDDILIEAGGQPITPEVFREYLKGKKAGDQLIFKIKRGDEVVELKGAAVAAP